MTRKNIDLADVTITKGNIISAMSGKKLKGYIEEKISELIESEYRSLMNKK